MARRKSNTRKLLRKKSVRKSKGRKRRKSVRKSKGRKRRKSVRKSKGRRRKKSVRKSKGRKRKKSVRKSKGRSVIQAGDNNIDPKQLQKILFKLRRMGEITDSELLKSLKALKFRNSSTHRRGKKLDFVLHGTIGNVFPIRVKYPKTLHRSTQVNRIRTRTGGKTSIENCFGFGGKYSGFIDHKPIMYYPTLGKETFKVMNWNVQGLSEGGSNWSNIKRNCVKKIVEKNQPDFLFLSEVSHKLEENFFDNYKFLYKINQLNRDLQPGTKQQRLYVKKSWYEKNSRKIAGVHQKRIGKSFRPGLVLNVRTDKGIVNITGVHSDASVRGGAHNALYFLRNKTLPRDFDVSRFRR